MLAEKNEKRLSISKDLSNQKRSELGEQLARLQRELAKTDKSMLVLVDGWESSGRGYLLNDLTRELDPKLYEVESFEEKNDHERKHHYLYRFLKAAPRHGHIAFFDRSFYYDLFSSYEWDNDQLEKMTEDISFLEKALYDDDTLIIKFFLHQTEEEMAERMEGYDKDPFRQVLLSDRDYVQLKHYDNFKNHFEFILKQTDFEGHPWHVLYVDGKKDQSRLALDICIQALSDFLFTDGQNQASFPAPSYQLHDKNWTIDQFDLSPTLSDDIYHDVKDALQERAGHLMYECFKQEKSIVVAYEGTDAAGKGGNIERLTRRMDPRLYDVATTSAPSEMELAHHYLWRFNEAMPIKGRMTIFDRTWYGRVLVERVEKLTPHYRWKAAYEEINQMEENLSKQNMLILKYLILIDKDEQLKRFKDRASDPDKQHKLTDEDWRNRKKFDAYKKAMNDMVCLTSTPYAPWKLIAGTNKKYARIAVLKDFIQRVEKFLKN